MKKVIVAIAILVASATSTFALNPEKTDVFYKLNNERVFNGLIKYLETNDEQTENLKYIFKKTENKIKHANQKNDEIAFENAIVFNLANAKHILSGKQYRKYLTLINLTISNDNYYNALLAENK